MKNTRTSKAIKQLKESVNAKSYYELSNLLGTPATSIQRYKNGDVSITLDKLDEMADNIGYEIEINFNRKTQP